MNLRPALVPGLILLTATGCTAGKTDTPFTHGGGEDSGDDTGEAVDSGDSGETGETGDSTDTGPATGRCAWDAGSLSTRTATGAVADEGFGSALALSPSGVWVGAPHGSGRVYAVTGTDSEVVLEADGRLGAALTPVGTSFVAGAPLADGRAGEVFSDSGATVGHGGSLLGIALASQDDTWVAATASGWLSSSGDVGAISGHPSSVALRDGVIAVGFAHGSHALNLNGSTVARTEDADEAGFALAAGDLDGDGETDWVVGAPGAGVVYVLDGAGTVQATIRGSGGRFGAALAVADVDGDGTDDLLVGAPMAGEDVTGEADLYLNGDLSSAAYTWSGGAAGDQLGFAVAATGCRAALGAPGAADAQGSVLILDAASSQ